LRRAILPPPAPARDPLLRAWGYVLLPATVLLALAGAPAVAVAPLALLPLLLSCALLWRSAHQPGPSPNPTADTTPDSIPEAAPRWPRRARTLLFVGALFFALSAGLLLLPTGWWPPLWGILMVGADLLLLGGAVAALDAFDEGESLGPDLVRSGAGAGLVTVLLGLPLVLALAAGAAPGGTLLALLLATTGTGIALQTLADPLQDALDGLIFPGAVRSPLRRARAGLRHVTSALPRVDPDLDPAALDEEDFARLTRRALSHYGDLPRLASSPLTRLPLITRRLALREAPDGPLERAAELKGVLAESIARLKPRGTTEFGTSDEWRYYNALYFPYVAGLRPYSRNPAAHGTPGGPGGNGAAGPDARAALDWFRRAVPERTLYHWQQAAARAVARDVLERSRKRDG
jgi:hypothetical protein